MFLLQSQPIKPYRIAFGARIDASRYNAALTLANPSKSFLEPPDPMVMRLFRQLGKNAAVIDVGAGRGRYVRGLLKRPNIARITAVEISPCGQRAIQSLQQNKTAGPCLSVIDHNVLDPFPAEHEALYDMGLMNNVSQHFSPTELEKAIRHCLSVLKPGGVFVFNALVKPHQVIRKFNPQPSSIETQTLGSAWFAKQDVLAFLRAQGLRTTVIPHQFRRSDPAYLRTNVWGFQRKAGTDFPMLKWFVCTKPLAKA